MAQHATETPDFIRNRRAVCALLFVPINCFDDCYEGIEPLILTADLADWTGVGPQCCPISAAPACCMDFGGARGANATCGTACDGMPAPTDPAWEIAFDGEGCPSWSIRNIDYPGPDCCGCPNPAHDAGAP